jgi:hypothetical protein
MKILLDINDNKAYFFMEVLKNFSFAKATPITDSKALFLKEFKDTVEEVKLANKGEIKLQSAKNLLIEL